MVLMFVLNQLLVLSRVLLLSLSKELYSLCHLLLYLLNKVMLKYVVLLVLLTPLKILYTQSLSKELKLLKFILIYQNFILELVLPYKLLLFLLLLTVLKEVNQTQWLFL